MEANLPGGIIGTWYTQDSTRYQFTIDTCRIGHGENMRTLSFYTHWDDMYLNDVVTGERVIWHAVFPHDNTAILNSDDGTSISLTR